jgi:nucleotide-sensitive chloride channel 1A
MQLETPPPAGEDIPSVIELVLIPAESDSTQSLFEAVSNCSNLVPDEDEDMEEGAEIQFEGNIGYEGISGLPGVQMGATDGGLPPPFPGSGGWITAENVSEYFDADGNWIGGEVSVEVLGDGAGRVRGFDEVEGEAEMNGHDEGDEASKRPRTD